MKKVVLSLFFVTVLSLLQAQPEDKKINKITFLLVDGEYEKAVFKTEGLKESDEYKKNAWVYFYLSQSYYEIAKKPELQEDYPKAMKNSLKAAYKLYKYKDKTGENAEVYEEAQEYLSILKDSVITISEIFYDTENPRKAAYFLKQIVKFDPNDYGIWLMKGIYEIKARNVGEGVKSIMLAMDSLNENYVPDEVSAQTLVDALDEYALIIKSGEYDKYFEAYKFKPTDADVQNALAMKEDFKSKYLAEEEEVDKVERKKESETIYKTFRSEDISDDEE